MAEPFEYLFSPLRIGPLTVPNRIVFSAHVTLFAEVDGLPNERQVYYYAERARGGAGCIVVGGSVCHPSSYNYPFRNLVCDERAIPTYRRLTAAVHEHGAKIFTQLYHYGAEMSSVWSRQPVLAPSPLPCGFTRETPKEMEKEEIEEILDSIARCARNAKEGGFDGIEFISAQGLLEGQFMSPHTNQRSDEYGGGSLENRLRFAYEAIGRAREAVGKDLVIGFKLNGDDFTPGGLTQAEVVEIAPRLAATGKIDYLHVCCGTFHSLETIVPDMSFPLGCMVYLAAAVREVVDLPVVAVKRIIDPLQAERILADGHADLIGMARALICDPEWPQKAREGRFEEIRSCIGCTQGCIERDFKFARISCLQNPAVGEEKRWGIGTLKPAQTRKRVMVVGGGPAGMKAAEMAALRGHRVTLYEREKELGGQVNLAARVAAREEFGGIVRHLRQQVERLGVELRLGVEVTPERVQAEEPDAVVVATGALPLKTGYSSGRPNLPGIVGVEQDHVLTIWDVLKEEREIGERVILIDEDGHLQATSVAEFLADRGKKVEVITRLPYVGLDINPCAFEPQYQRLYQKGVVLTPFTLVKEISGKTVVTYQVYSGVERRIEGVDAVVLAMGSRANNGLYRSLKGRVKELYAAGDCLAPRKAIDAIYEGHLVGRSL